MNKLSKNIFLMLGLSTVFSICDINFAMGALDCSKAPDKGKYCFEASNKPECPAGCWCPGGNKIAVKKADSEPCRHPTNRCGDHGTHSYCKSQLGKAGVNYCPDDFPYSDKGAKSQKDCYKETEGVRYYYGQYSCEAGSFLPKTYKTCQKCQQSNSTDPDYLDNHYYCPGLTNVSYDPKKNQGKYLCKDGTVAVGGISCTIQCPSGTYMPINTRECVSCPSGNTCRGVTVTLTSEFATTDEGIEIDINPADVAGGSGQNCADGYYNSGNNCVMCTAGYYCENGVRTRCPDGYISTAGESSCTPCDDGESSNSNHTRCVKDTITVVPGKYLPKNSSASVNCYGTYNYCPGGFFEKNSDKDQGIYKCPLNGVTTNNGQSCKLSLSKSILENGDSGEGDCWKITSPSDYKRCVFGKTMVDAPNTANRSKSSLRETSVEKAMAPSQATAGK